MSVGQDVAKAALRALRRRPPVSRPGRKPPVTEGEYLYIRAAVRRRRQLERQLALVPTEEALARRMGVPLRTLNRLVREGSAHYAHLGDGPV